LIVSVCNQFKRFGSATAEAVYGNAIAAPVPRRNVRRLNFQLFRLMDSSSKGKCD